MNSALYSGWVKHRRFAPKSHSFSYRMGFIYLDLDEQDQLFSLSRLAGRGPDRVKTQTQLIGQQNQP